MPPSTTHPTVALVHGFPGGSTDFGLLADELITRGWDRDQLVVHDLVGFGAQAGEHSFDELWVPAQAERLQAALAGRRDVVLVGHDVGGPIALAAADLLGSRVRGLVLTSCNLLRDPPLPGPFRLLKTPVLGPLVESLAFSRASLWAMARFGRRRGPLPRPNSPAEGRAIRTIFATALRDPAAHFGPVQHLLATYPRPIHLLTGDRDPFFTVEHARRQAALARHSRLTVLPRTGHFPQLEAPHALADLVEAEARQAASTQHH
jgi:pimeloyl-ACP methyl ester carboxylesterase